jgi:NitT/TauT family transport system substrate-binding protein
MSSFKGLDRRELLGLGLGIAGIGMLPTHAFAQKQVSLLAAYYGALTNTAPVAVGMKKGFYDTSNVKVSEVVSTIGGGTAIRNMVGGGLDYGIVGTAAAATAIQQGIGVKIVHGVIRTMEDLFWVSMPGSGISSIQDLKGKKIGFTKPKSISETMVMWMLEKHNLVGQVETVSLGGLGAGLSALESGGVDAALILEPLWSARKDRYQMAFTLAEFPPMMQMVGVATDEMIANEPEVLRDLVAGWTKSANFTYDNRDEAAMIISETFGAEKLPPEIAKSAVNNMADINYWSRGELDIEGLEQFLEAMRRQGEWEGEADWSKMIDQSFLPEDLRRKV